MFFLGALYLQRILHYSPIDVGLAFLPVAVGIGVVSLRLVAPLSLRFGAKAISVAGLVLVAAGLLAFRRAPVNAGFIADLLPAMVLMGVGAGLVFPALTTLAMSAATPEDAGLASGLVNTTQQVGGALGLAVLATLATTRTNGLSARGASSAVALTDGYHLAFTIAAGLVIAAIGLGLAGLRTRPARSLEAVPSRSSIAEPEAAIDYLGEAA